MLLGPKNLRPIDTIVLSTDSRDSVYFHGLPKELDQTRRRSAAEEVWISLKNGFGLVLGREESTIMEVEPGTSNFQKNKNVIQFKGCGRSRVDPS